MAETFLPGGHRGKYMRYDTAVILKRFYLCERMLVVSQAGWLPSISNFETNMLLPKILWEDAMTANALRERVFELRFPSRILEVGTDQSLVDLIEYAQHAPNELAFLRALSQVFKPELKKAYESYLELADNIGDGPTYRFLSLAIDEKASHIEQLERQIAIYLAKADRDAIQLSDRWIEDLKQKLSKLGGIGLDTPEVSSVSFKPATPFKPSEVPQREKRFNNLRFYWPDMVDPTFPYGSGMQLQLRSAISHFNEVWAVETAGFVLYSMADELGWEFIYDAARWVYDESRHCRMGYERLKSWGFSDEELPLGTYIYDSCKGQDPIYRLGMLFYFESKNIGKKIDRIKNFESMNDRMSQHDMDFDWADETIHTSYGKRWLSETLKLRGKNPDDYTDIKDVCEQIVANTLHSATDEEITEIKNVANHLIEKAASLHS